MPKYGNRVVQVDQVLLMAPADAEPWPLFPRAPKFGVSALRLRFTAVGRADAFIIHLPIISSLLLCPREEGAVRWYALRPWIAD